MLFVFAAFLMRQFQDQVTQKLDQQAFPYVKDSPTSLTPSPSLRGSIASPTTPTSGSLRSSKPNWHIKTKKVVEIRQRLLVFVAGGMTYSEMREAYLLSEELKQDIIIGEYPRHWGGRFGAGTEDCRFHPHHHP